ncbi:MAG: hypothetical protein GXP49_16885 [Deltaproteobacteria bacterium]|nr:hypothetical protein [Deltaproteobacteria bacterium]
MAESGSDLLSVIKALVESKLSELQQRVEEALKENSSRLIEELGALQERIKTLEDLARKRQEALDQVTNRKRGRPPGSGRGRKPREKGTCSVQGCNNPAVARGLCKNHYAQQRYREKREAAGFMVKPRKAYKLRASEDLPGLSDFVDTSHDSNDNRNKPG